MRFIKYIFSFKWFLIIVLFFLLLFLYAKLGPNNWSVVALADRPQVESGWSEPKGVGINTNKWEDGVHISGDGNILFYSYYPGNFIQDSLNGKLKDDVDVYYSEKPFNKSKKHSLSEEKWSEGGVMMSGSDIYYRSDRNRLNADDLYKNGKVVIDTFDESEQDPHYCFAQKELYFWADGIIYVNNNNQTLALPFPINDGSSNVQPFLTPDCQQMYFSSNRGDGVFKILRSKRLSNDLWAEPEIVIASRQGVGDPTLTDDGKTMFFVQILKSAKGEMNADIFFVEKIIK